MREGLARPDGGRGPRYAALINDFALNRWATDVARTNSPSLDHAITSLTGWNGR